MNLDEIIQSNRNHLKKVSNFITREDWLKSPYHYGLPDFAFPKINLPIGDDITYTDLLQYLSQHLKKDVVYFEIGVSVLKNFYQMANYFQNSTLIGFDINLINPSIEKLFQAIDLQSNPKTYHYSNNQLYYYQGDVFQPQDFAKCHEAVGWKKYNVVFSDALHRPDAIIKEYHNGIKKYLDDDEFILYYDDLEGGMKDAFFKIATDLCQSRNLSLGEHVAVFKIGGWLGKNEYQHTNGIISTLPIKTLIPSSIKLL